ncbi:XdhC /CoxI family-like protein [Agrobacterium sp. a22-2]|uniref:XdhC family protein n=1 Tax=Agrobacterium sp. a22-2 TaxID=2283840 RepID=UPI00144783FE|nr:XdhC/CoxI family protein [Agrobacterium sp. a22-2]NKN35350.1 XdhC /CoxI family-like protein [Agrobacterium sp. a22-2]
MTVHVDVMDLAARLKTAEQAFVLATVVRTVSVTAAKAGAKAVIRPDGTIAAGWIGGGCARGAVLRAANAALADGQARLVSVQPGDLLADLGVRPGDSRDGVQFARNMCPSKGSMDIFIEPVLPRPALMVFGASPVALALVSQARALGYHVTLAAPAADLSEPAEADRWIDGYAFEKDAKPPRFIVVSTQGRGDEAALKAAVETKADYCGFVGSRRKMAALREKLTADGVDAGLLDRVKGPAGLDLGAITPDEIALSVLAEITRLRRRGQRGDGPDEE